MKKIRGTLILLLTALIWGMAFVAQSSVTDSIQPFTFNGVRSLLGAFSLLCVLGVRSALEKKEKETKDRKKEPSAKGNTVLGGICCGVIMFAASNLQQFGIAAYPDTVASSGRAGFITATYVIMVAVIGWILSRKIEPAVLAAVIGCMAGMYLLCLSGGFQGLYLGDVLVFACAVVFTAHILTVDYFSETDSVKMSCIQFLVCGVLSLIAMALFEQPDWQNILAAWVPILYAGVFSCGIAYTLQMVGQKEAQPAVASIALSFESVFAALAGWVILGERLSGKELLGCGLVFLSVIVAQLPEMKKEGAL